MSNVVEESYQKSGTRTQQMDRMEAIRSGLPEYERLFSDKNTATEAEIETSIKTVAAIAAKPKPGHAAVNNKDIVAKKTDATPNRPFPFVFKSFVSLPRSNRREDQGRARKHRSVFIISKRVQVLRWVHVKFGSNAILKPSDDSLKPSSMSSMKRCFSRKPQKYSKWDFALLQGQSRTSRLRSFRFGA